MSVELSREELESAHCWENDDRVSGRPEMTEFRRRVRYHQARWREANGHPIGTQPIVPRPGTPARPVGSRLRFEQEQLDLTAVAGAHQPLDAHLAVEVGRVGRFAPGLRFVDTRDFHRRSSHEK